MSDLDIKSQTEAALRQWGELWKKHSAIHAKDPQIKNNLIDFGAHGVGRAILSVANGYSLEENMQTIIANKGKCDIICCDKSLGPLIENGIEPDFCLVCDANVDYDRYLKPYENRLDKTILLINVCANPLWSENGNWRRKYFFINKDIAESEKIFGGISGCTNIIAAGTNVSNAMIIMLTQCDNNGKKNFFGYDKIILIGYDYSWRADGKYYAYNTDGDGKDIYMKHAYVNTYDGDFAYSSGNLIFSSKWLQKYISNFNLPVINCSKKTILPISKFGELGKQMNYAFRKEDSGKVKRICATIRDIQKQQKELFSELNNIEKAHLFAMMESI